MGYTLYRPVINLDADFEKKIEFGGVIYHPPSFSEEIRKKVLGIKNHAHIDRLIKEYFKWPIAEVDVSEPKASSNKNHDEAIRRLKYSISGLQFLALNATRTGLDSQAQAFGLAEDVLDILSAEIVRETKKSKIRLERRGALAPWTLEEKLLESPEALYIDKLLKRINTKKVRLPERNLVTAIFWLGEARYDSFPPTLLVKLVMAADALLGEQRPDKAFGIAQLATMLIHSEDSGFYWPAYPLHLAESEEDWNETKKKKRILDDARSFISFYEAYKKRNCVVHEGNITVSLKYCENFIWDIVDVLNAYIKVMQRASRIQKLNSLRKYLKTKIERRCQL